MIHSEATPGPWYASQYMDTQEWGVLNADNRIVVGISSRLTEADAHLIAEAVNAYRRATP